MTEKLTATLNEIKQNGGFCVWIKWLGYAVITEGGYEKLNSAVTSQLVADGQLRFVTKNEEEEYYEVAKQISGK